MSIIPDTTTTEDAMDRLSLMKICAVTFNQNRLAVVGVTLVVIVILLAVLAPLIAPIPPTSQDYTAILQGPSLEHLFGTDNLGRDIFSRVLFGYRIIFAISFSGVAIGFILGTFLGLIAGYFNGWLNQLIMRSTDVILSFPTLVLGLALIAVIGPSQLGIIVVISSAYTPIFARVARSETVSIKNEEFIRGLKVKGASNLRILFRHILPNIISVVLVSLTLMLAFSIIATSTLSYLGVGVQPPRPSLGLMLKSGTSFIHRAWWMVLFPGIAILLPVVGLNAIGDGLRDYFDPSEVEGGF